MPTPIGERLIIPGRYLEELKSADMAVVDLQATFLEVDDHSPSSCDNLAEWLKKIDV